jgi:hypothetical protein
VPIEALQPGDLVLAVPDGDPLGTPQFMPITAIYHNQSTELLTVAFTDGSTISLTAAHEVYTATGGWGLAEDVRPGDVMLDKQGDLRIVDRVERAYAPVRTYNLTVAGSHTFFADGVWVHNCGKRPTSYVYGARAQRGGHPKDPYGPNHNFNDMFDGDLIKNGTPMPGKDGFMNYVSEGVLNGRKGVFEIGGHLANDGTLVIVHRLFRPY